MKWSFLSMTAFLVAGACYAQQPRIAARPNIPAPSPPVGTLVALIDMVKVFEGHPRHQQAITHIKNEIRQFDDEIKVEREGIAKLAKEQKEFRIGSPQYKKLDKLIASRTAQLQLRMQLKRKDILEREAKVFYKTHTEVMGHLAEFCDRYKIQLVLRNDTTEIDPNSRKSVLAGVNRGVVWAKRLDITQHLLERVNK